MMKNFAFVFTALLIFSIPLLSQSDEIDKLFIKGKYEIVIKLLQEKKSVSDTLSAKEYYQLGLAYQNIYNTQKAVEYLREASRLDSQNPDYLYLFGMSLSANGQSNFAIGVLSESLERDPDNISAKIELGKLWIENQNYETAKNIFNNLFKADSQNTYYARQIALCHLKQNNIDSAKQFYQFAFNNNPSDHISAYQLAGLYFNESNYDATIQILQAALERNPTNLPLNRLAGETVFKMKKYRDAKIQFKTLIDFGDSTAANYQKLGFSYYLTADKDSLSDDSLKNKEIKTALEYFYKSFYLNDKDPLTAFYIGICYSDLQNTEAAIEYLNKSINLMFPDYIADVYYHLATNYEKNGNKPEAISAFGKAYKYDPSRDIILFQMAGIFEEYYEDKSVPLLYYDLFLRKTKINDENIKNYARSKVESIKEKLHFR
ncbi:MAG: tetratricopeptide repeat protein [Melioribacteraceae bacterium]|nr:tetratricopeptide repeat protein [Melioribacteraceae bacterium]